MPYTGWIEDGEWTEVRGSWWQELKMWWADWRWGRRVRWFGRDGY